jgi:hypothetical protein
VGGLTLRASHSFVAVVLVVVCAQQLAAQKATDQHAITHEEARELVYGALYGQAVLQLDRFGLNEFNDSRFPRFYVFVGTWNNPAGSVITGHYAVDSRTGDVWDAVVCREYKSKHLRKMQESVRNRQGISGQDYQRLRVRGPMC